MAGRKNTKKATEEIEEAFFELNGKEYQIDLSLIPKNGTFLLPTSSAEHTRNSILLDEDAQALLIKFGIATEKPAEEKADGGGTEDPPKE